MVFRRVLPIFNEMETALEKLSKHELIALLHKEREALQHQDVTLRQHLGTLQQQEQTLQQQAQTLQQKDEILRSKDDDIVRKQDQVDYLKAQVEQYKRMLFGQKRERFESDASQLALPFEPTAQQQAIQEEELTEKIEYIRKKQSASSHKGRVALPAHLPVEEIEIHPEGDLTQMECIGKEITEELECIPAKLFIRRYIVSIPPTPYFRVFAERLVLAPKAYEQERGNGATDQGVFRQWSDDQRVLSVKGNSPIKVFLLA